METLEEEIVTTDTGEELLKEDCVWSETMGSWIDKDNKCESSDGIISEDFRDDNYNFCEDTNDYHHHNNSWWCEVSEKHYSDDEPCVTSYCDTVGHEDSFSESYDYRYIYRGVAYGHWLHSDQTIYCNDIEEDVHEDDAHYCDRDDCYYYDEDNVHSPEKDMINKYHSSSQFIENLNYLYKKSPFSIGFEVEKTEFDTDDYGCASDDGDMVGEYSFFAGFETDSSCGVEGVSHVLPLSPPRSKWRKNVFNMIDEASCIINSDSDTSCGGHITVSIDDNLFKGDAYDAVNKLKPKLALMYAMYRYRLKRSYCSNNKSIKKDNNTKYSPINIKGSNRIEFRLPSRVTSVKQLKLRYDFMYLMLKYTFIEDIGFNEFNDKVRPILNKMYGDNTSKIDTVYSYAEDFRRYLSSEEVSPRIEEFINN